MKQMNYFETVSYRGRQLRFDKGKVGAPYGNDNAAKDHVKESIKKVNQKLPKGEKVKSTIKRIPREDYERIRSEINSQYGFDKHDTIGQTACHWVTDRHDKSRGYCVLFENGGQGFAEPKFLIPLDPEMKEVIDMLTEELRR